MKARLFPLIVSILLAWSSDAFASMVSLDILYIKVPQNLKSNIYLDGPGTYYGVSNSSLSQVLLWDSGVSNSVWVMNGGWPTTEASATLGSHTATASTRFSLTPPASPLYGRLSMFFTLNPIGGRQAIGSSSAYAGDIQFTANVAGPFTANLLMYGDLDLTTDLLGDWASASVTGSVSISNDTTGRSSTTYWTLNPPGQSQIIVTDGVDWHQAFDTLLTTNPVDFAEGDMGRFSGTFGVYAEATTVVPIPGAVLLGSLGMSFASWLLYRRKEA